MREFRLNKIETFPQDLIITVEGEHFLEGNEGQAYSRISTNQGMIAKCQNDFPDTNAEAPFAIRSPSAALFLSQMVYSSPLVVDFIKAKYPGFETPETGSDAWNSEIDNIPALITFERVK